MIDRRAFMQMAVLLGIGMTLGACSSDEAPSDKASSAGGASDAASSHRAIVIGAGAAGMSAGYLLARSGVDVTILEAAPSYGGRIKTTHDFVDFPIALGGEWIHSDADELARVVDDDTVAITTEVVGYGPPDQEAQFDGTLNYSDLDDWDDLKFVGGTWLTFFEQYVVPSIEDAMQFDTQVVTVDYRGDTIVLTDATGEQHEADSIIVTAPIAVLRDGDIEFVPPLPDRKRRALDEANVWGGMKVFIEFDERFYPAALQTPDSETSDGQKLYYDAAHGQTTDANVMGLFVVGAQAERYQAVDPGDELRDLVLAELDTMFDGAASRSYRQHIATNWSDEPFIRQAYLADNARSRTSTVLAETIDDRIYFAGDAYTRFDDWSEVHLAARSARDAVADLLG